MKTRKIIIFLAIILLSGNVSAQYDFEPLNFNAGCTAPAFGICSFARGINNRGDVVGWGSSGVLGPAGSEVGFLMGGKSGIVTNIEYPGAEKTRASGNNARGEIVGQYNDLDGVHAFLLDKKGNYHNIDFPGSVYSAAWGINARGQVVGGYSLASDGPGVAHGYVRNSNGSFESYDFPAVMIASGTLLYTRFRDISDNGNIVGIYRVVGGDFPAVEVHGFLLDKKGNFTNIDYPVGPTTDENFFVSLPLGINNSGQVSGGYIFWKAVAGPPPEHGYVQSSKGVFTTVDFPGADATEIYKSTESGVLVGGYRVGAESNAFRAFPN